MKTSVKHLNFSDNPLGNVFISEFELRARTMSFFLTRLSLSSCNFITPGVAPLFTALQRGPSLEHLSLDNFKYNPKELTAFSAFLLKSNNLKNLSVMSCFFGDEEVRIIGEGFSSQSHLEQLNLSYNKIANAGAKLLAEKLTRLRRLKVFNVSNNSIAVLRALTLERRGFGIDQADEYKQTAHLYKPYE
eukprot:TRINITY_DN7221_c0_g1_i8.p2 TRINITY_DN7221_c0_g1~~TRINITY_DN7221_c0_g1_i8.p2  ORF type:complete len:189 (-),score=28.71 TRINITY_DN7221_c0_g1_i8:232-798(-)